MSEPSKWAMEKARLMWKGVPIDETPTHQLEALVAQALDDVREECARAAESTPYPTDGRAVYVVIAEAIRALGGAS